MTFSKHLSHCQTPVKRLILGLFDRYLRLYLAFLTACQTVTLFFPYTWIFSKYIFIDLSDI